MPLDRFTNTTRSLIRNDSRIEAERYGQDYISSVHLILPLLELEEGRIRQIYQRLELDTKYLVEEIREIIPREDVKPPKEPVVWTDTLKEIIKNSIKYADSLRVQEVDTTHLFYGVVSTEPLQPRQEENVLWKILGYYDLDRYRIKELVTPQKQS